MAAPIVYEVRWKSIPLGAIRDYRDWYDPFLGSGVYMMVLATTQKANSYVAFYIGKSEDLGTRWRQHLHDWFIDPHEKYWIPKCADAFLDDPVKVFNTAELAQGLSERQKTQCLILQRTWFCFAEVNALHETHRLEHIEYVLQEALKQHTQICKEGHIGDAGARHPPLDALTINNVFGRPYLKQTLPQKIRFEPSRVWLPEQQPATSTRGSDTAG